MKQPRVVVVGHATIDDIQQADGRILAATPGGAAIYASLGAMMSGGAVLLVTLVGQDYPLKMLHGEIPSAGHLDLRYVGLRKGASIRNEIRYRAGGERRIEVVEWDRMDELTPTVADLPADLTPSDVVLLSPGSVPVQLELARALRRRGCRVVADSEVHYFPREEQRNVLRQVIAAVDYFVPSVEHLRVLFGDPTDDIEAYSRRLRDLGCPWIVIKYGAAGSTALDCMGGRHWRIPAVEGLRVRETTGAGDAFDGGFVAALAAGADPVDAACRATVSASFAVEWIGATMPAHFTPELANERYAAVFKRIVEQRHWHAMP